LPDVSTITTPSTELANDIKRVDLVVSLACTLVPY
jgi:hypothetical protein